MDQQTYTLLAGFAHELRTPLGAISGYAELLRLGARGPMPDAQVELLGRILQNQRRMVTLLEALTDYSSVLAGTLEPQWHTQSVDDVIRNAVLACATLSQARALRMEVTPPVGHVTVRTDATLCSSVLVAVLEDACHHAGAGETITLAVTSDEDMVRVIVAAPGDPLTAADAEGLFTPFRSATRTTEAQPLGLARARAVARALGGDVQPAAGATHRALAVTMRRAPDTPD